MCIRDRSDTLFTASSKDLMMARKIKEMIDIGIVSLKVEGRMRSNYYVATVINTYRGIIDCLLYTSRCV